MKSSTAEVYHNEMPGGQYTNLYEQAQAIGLGHRWHEICRAYTDVNQLFGDIVKVTPSSKAVGDMALFLITNNISAGEVLDSKRELAFPESVVDLLAGRMGEPPGGFPPAVRDRVLRGIEPVKGRPGESLKPADFAAKSAEVEKLLGRKPSQQEMLSSLMFPRVFAELVAHEEQFGDTSALPTPVFLYGPAVGEEWSVDIEQGKRLIVKYLTVGDVQQDGRRSVFFELNGQPRQVTVFDRTHKGDIVERRKADPANASHVGAPMPGAVVTVVVKAGDKVAVGQKLLTLEAMKMETTIYAEREGKVAEVLVQPGTQVEAGELVLRWE
jgi:pyruvate carboxylase